MSRLVFGLLVLLLFGFRCESASTMGTVCTLIGCDSGLLVELEAPPEAPYRIEAHVSGVSPRYVQVCQSQAACSPFTFFRAFIPDWAIIEVVSAVGTERYEVRPVYERVQPNGPGCDPVCMRATVRLPRDAINH